MLQRQEHADVAARRIQRSHQRDQQQRPEVGEQGETETGECHQHRRSQQQAAVVVAPGMQPDREREQAGTDEGGGRDDAHVQRAEAESQQIQRQQQAHVAVAERAQALRDEQAVDVIRFGVQGPLLGRAADLDGTPSWREAIGDLPRPDACSLAQLNRVGNHGSIGHMYRDRTCHCARASVKLTWLVVMLLLNVTAMFTGVNV